MVTTEQIKNGFKRYLDNEIIAKMQISPNSLKRGLIITGVNLWADHNINSMLANPETASSLGIVDENGHYDIGKLAEEFKKTMPSTGYKIDINTFGIHLGELSFYGNDIDTLHNYIVNA
jgi:hypothetical protein